jgi:uncharacterized cupredoxin-like copper-binding protein
MAFHFQQQHSAMLLKYSGISFISGSVNHGFFSGERSLWTAAIGIVLFVLGAWMAHRPAEEAGQDVSLGRTLLWGSLLSIGLGFFTGGLQHFPDSPARSAWVVPLGFAVSVLALQQSESLRWTRSAVVYALTVGLLATAGSWAAWQWLERHPLAQDAHHHGAETDAPSLPAQVVSRSVEVRMDDQMRFYPSRIDVQAGETLRFVVRNDGQVEHELVLGSESSLREHAEAMKQGAGHAHGHAGAAISLQPGQTGELVVTFPTATTVQMACLVPGHYEAGMRGTVEVSAASAAPSSAPAATPMPAASHGAHQH